MTDGGHVPNEGLPEHLLAGPDQLGGPEGVAAVAPVQGVALDGSLPGVPGAGVPGAVPPGAAVLPPQGVPAHGGPAHGVPAQAVPVQAVPVQAVPVQGVPVPGTPAPGAPLGAPGFAAPAPGTPGAAGEAWAAGPRPTFHFVDQPDGLDDEDDLLLMPGPQGSWGEPTVPAADPAADPQTPPGTPVEPSWPPLEPPVLGAADPAGAPHGFAPQTAQAAPGVQTVPAQQQGPEPVTAVQSPRRPLHAGPPIPDPSLMTGQVPVRSLADRGPSTGSTPAHGIPVVPAMVQPEPAAVPVAVQPAPAPQPVEAAVQQPPVVLPVAVPVEAPVVAEAVVEAPVETVVEIAAAPESTEPAVVEPVAEPVAVAVEAPAEGPAVEGLAAAAEAEVAAEAQAGGGQPRRISAFLAAPTPHGLPQVEPVAEPVVEPVAAPLVEQSAPAAVGTEAEQSAPIAPVADPAEAAAQAEPETVEPAAPVAVEAVPAEQPEPVVEAVRPDGEAPVEPVAEPVAEPLVAEAPTEAPVDAPAEAQAPEAAAETAAGTGEMPSGQPVAAPADVPAEPVSAAPAEPAEAPAEEQPAVERPAVPTDAVPTDAVPVDAPPADAPAELPATEAAPVPQAEDGTPAAEPTAVTEPAEATAPAETPEAPVGPAEAVEPAHAEAAAHAEAPAVVEEPAEPAELAEPEEPAEPRGPAAPGYDEVGREAVHQVIRERRDIRNGFRPDPIPHEVLIRVLEAAHTAPSVGYSQPWDFVVIRSAKTRRKMHELAERQREAFADSLPKGRAKQFKEIKIEAILETPVNIVVTADRTRGGRHTLGRHTQPQMAPYSAALAVENLWLAARAEGLGVGWVSFFDEEELVRELGLPEHLEVVAYLCVGFVDAFPDEPELQQQGWAKKRPLSWVVHEEQYGNRALPGEEPHSVLSETLRGIRPLDAKALGEAWDRQKRMTKPAGSLGMLEIISAQLSGLSRKCPPPIPEPACVAVFAADHGVHAQGVTPWPQEVTAQMVGNFLAGGAVVNAFAKQIGTEVCVVDVGVAAELPEAIQQGRTTGLLPRKVKPGTDDMTQGPAMTREEALKALEVGIETARDLVAAGNKALITGDMGIANTTASAALISVFTGLDPAEVTGRGTGIDDATHARKIEVIRAALALHQPDPADPIGVLAAVGGLEHAALAGFLLGAASLRTPVILDGVIAGSAALVAKAIAPEVLAACIAGHRSAEPGHQAALAKLGLRPLIDLDLRLGEGTGALLALPLVQSAARAMHDVATFDSAGVTEKA
ncbi:nicotinate-nucleotide--dimethylbenzimidazole phosphoribosyltransferase [Kitasatospora purpeofusca]|uniref:Nicotinate-nucleotide--dimethylbenzimidazole phosphoribosyltransferase n=1 Tax=Kitasatospora purpeofusca TaxID=67352 RepID=A0ABZ1U7Q2_9ACTN|nr:nicotinate-nucleotide--dimethylbenzimidazole phosphoribosyltransferase [Kitasatospora purpeofusca]